MSAERAIVPRVRRRLRDEARRAVLAAFGRPLRCATCGRELFVALPVVWRGQVKLIGARESDVHVAFAAKDTLELRHAELDACPAPERPWVR
ncbi:MAG TPA: hypothetical protein VF715_04145 [Thermoleophilaceae bacterium]